ncbi:MAG: PASTA domain-containing protein [Bacteroidetes bacterium]|nr:PASTA domain-containing protein [Bacteroidota bacterium]MCW5896959.1 PASTA domain-containing protein [Bacteroidota bacterium]
MNARIKEFLDTAVRPFLTRAWQRLKPYASRFGRLLRAFFLSKRFLVAMMSLIAAFLLLNYVVMPWYVYHGGTLSVPDVTMMQYEEALKVLDDAGLVGIEGDRVLDNAHPIGGVITQNPAPGSIVKYGRHVYLTVCGGEVQVLVPQLRGRSLRDARFALERDGLVLGDIEYAASNQSPENTIISQSITHAARVKRGTIVGVVVSAGKPDRSVEIPNLFGKSISEAIKLLARYGLKVGNITYQVNIELLPNTIVDQYPQAGAAADSGKTVDLFVVKAGILQDEH